MSRSRRTLDAYRELCRQTLDRVDASQVEALTDDLLVAYREGRMVFLCGNGGSAANASHFAEDLGKSTLDPIDFKNDEIARLKVISLTDNTAYLLAWANDTSFQRVFVEQLKNLAAPGDLLVAISGSGTSRNISEAVKWANGRELTTWGVTGYSGGTLIHLAQKCLHVPIADMGLVESIHVVLFHWIVDELYARIHAKRVTSEAASTV